MVYVCVCVLQETWQSTWSQRPIWKSVWSSESPCLLWRTMRQTKEVGHTDTHCSDFPLRSTWTHASWQLTLRNQHVTGSVPLVPTEQFWSVRTWTLGVSCGTWCWDIDGGSLVPSMSRLWSLGSGGHIDPWWGQWGLVGHDDMRWLLLSKISTDWWNFHIPQESVGNFSQDFGVKRSYVNVSICGLYIRYSVVVVFGSVTE